MKAVRLVEARAPLRMEEVPVPTPGEGNLLLRVRAAGICHTDVHYRAGRSPAGPPPRTLGHEIAGVIERVGSATSRFSEGDRVCVHYVLSCGRCHYCSSGHEQFCVEGSMIGRYSDGGYAEYVMVPERNVLPLPEEIPFETGAILMCSAATSFHTLRKSRLRGGETVAVFGVGGLGISAIQLAHAFGALDVYAVDINPDKTALAERYGARGIDASTTDPVAEIRRLTGGRGVDVALELIGLPITMKQAVRSLGVMGRAVVAGIADRPLEVDTYRELLGPEAEIIGTNDHLMSELPLLLELARRGKLDLAGVVRTIPLDADAVNKAMDALEGYRGEARTVIVP